MMSLEDLSAALVETKRVVRPGGVTRYHVTDAGARQVDSDAEPVDGSHERRHVPDDWMEMSTSGWQRLTQVGEH